MTRYPLGSGTEPHPQLRAEFDSLRDIDTVRLIDLLIVRKEADGKTTADRRRDLTTDEATEVGALAGLDVTVACPPDYEPDPRVLAAARSVVRTTGAELAVVHDPVSAVAGADAVYADVWASMGEEAERDARTRVLAPFQVTAELMELAKPEAIFLHCLPAKRGEEVAAEVIDGPQSVVWDEAENRLHVQKALLEYLVCGRVDP